MLRNKLLILLSMGLIITACQSSDEAAMKEADEAAIRQVWQQITEKFVAADLNGFMDCIAEDQIDIRPRQPIIKGKESLRSNIEQAFAENTFKWNSTIESIEVSGNLAFIRTEETESWTPKKGGETGTWKSRDIMIFRRGSDGKWKVPFG